jgi:DNA-binding CsgD family transcriptional regulator
MERIDEIGSSAVGAGDEGALCADALGPRWAAAVGAVTRLAPAAQWRESVAAKLGLAVGGHPVVVATCPPNRPEHGRLAVSPPAWAPLGVRIVAEVLPELARSGEGWPGLYRRHGVVCPVLTALAGAPAAERLGRDLLQPAGFVGCLCAFLVTPPEALVGWLVIATPRPEPEALTDLAAPLRKVARLAAETLSVAFDIAESWGFLTPGPCPDKPGDTPALRDGALSRRERQIVALVADGLSDANVAARLSITESTVGSHLQRIYRKLGVHSRIEIVARAYLR